MGPTSSWAFCRRVLAIIGSRMPDPKAPINPWDLETLNLTWSPVGLYEQPNVDNLPSYDYAVFLLATVKYNLGLFYQIIDHDKFQQRMERLYENPAAEAKRSRYWFSQFLFVLAFGEAFNQAGRSKSVPGISYASRAMALLPAIVPMERNPLAAAEALCLGALYLQALDLRLMSFQLVGQALRICVLDGLHRHMPPEQVEPRYAQRCNTVFWSAYIIDREFSTLVGAPTSIRDEDVTTKLPSELSDTPEAAALELHIRLSRLMATILNGVYGVDRNFDGSLLIETQSVLHKLAAVSKHLNSYMETSLQGADIRTSKIATSLILSYHHCVVLTTRPLVMCALQQRLASTDNDTSIPSGPISCLLKTCVSSALNTLKALKALGDNNLLDCFLPFQLESAWSSSFLLKLIEALSPDFISDRSWLAAASCIFDTMISRGSPAARLRKREFEHLGEILTSFMSYGRQENIKDAETANEHNPESHGDTNSVDEMLQWGLLDNQGGFALSPTELMDLAEELQLADFIVQDE
ncbi:fungal specific transcription factor [Colletotrichum truncatum]|uniref:Fungal specific transcription factor n=1 Tax=Colletotrichum truncatum TaxID=5467 RepID=A0ACC3YHY3_COLTU